MEEIEEKPKREVLLEKWKEKDPYLQNLEGYEKFVEANLQPQETVRFSQGKEMENVLSIIKKVNETADFYINSEGITLRQTNKKDTAMIEVNIPPEALEEIDASEVGTQFEVNLEDFAKYFKRSRAGEPVVLERQGEKVLIKFPHSNRHYTVPAQESAKQKLPTVDYDESTIVKMKSRILRSAVLDAKEAGNIIRLKTEDGKFEIESVGNATKSRYGGWNYSSGKNHFVQVFDEEDAEVQGEAQSYYNLDFLGPLISTSFKQVKLRWGNEFPITASYSFFDGLATLQGVVAPTQPGEV